MFKSRLFWKVISNFAILLAILTAMTVLTINVLSQIERNFSTSTVNIQSITSIDQLRVWLISVPAAADNYLMTGKEDLKTLYETGTAREFDSDLAVAQRLLPDSLDQVDLQQIRELFYSWVQYIGDKKIQLYDLGVKGDELERELRALGAMDAEMRYLEQAHDLLQTLYRKQTSAVPISIDAGVRKARDIGFFIIVINVLLAMFSIVLGFVLTRSITKPVELLRTGTRGIMTGSYDKITIHRKDEFGDLADDFNRMSVMLQNNYGRLTAYSELMTSLNRYDSLEDVQSKSLEILCTHTKSAIGALYLLDADKTTLSLEAGYALKDEHAIREYRLGQGIPGQCALLNQTMEVSDVSAGGGFVVETGLVSVVPAHIVAAPIVFQENVIGVVVLGSTNIYAEMYREVINNSVPQIGVAIMNAMNNDATKKLSKEIAGKNQELGNKNSELQKAYRVKSDFLSNMSHELRTPLNSIIGFTAVLLGQHGDPLTADQRKALEKVLKNGKHLLQLINDILDFSKIESGRSPVNIEADEVANVISMAMVSVEPMVNAKGVKLVHDIAPSLPLLNTDILKVKQILLNLLSNAAKFTEQGDITISGRMLENGMLAISVKDSGIGIEDKNIDKVFEEFQQIDSSNSRKYKGTGLGLPIARSYARLLGGDLSLTSVYGKGSTFTLAIPPVFPKDKLPKTEPAPAAPPKPVVPQPTASLVQTPPRVTVSTPKPVELPKVLPKPQEGSKGIQVLCIDDEPEVIELLQRYLVPEGFSVRGALSGDEGITLAEQLQPAIITLDIMMPEKDGWQVLRELKSNPKTCDIPVIIHSVVDNRPLAVSLGALDVMPKPSEAKKILDVVTHALKSKDKRILIVDDNEDFAHYVQIILEQEGYLTNVANSGEEALKAVAEGIPAMIFLDLSMPGMDGFEVVRRLRMKQEWRDIPVVILSGKDLSKEEREVLHSQIQEFIEKGHFTREVLGNVLKKTIPPPKTA